MVFTRLAALAVLLAFPLTACSDDPVTKPAEGDNNADTVSQSSSDLSASATASSPETEAAEPELPSDEEVVEFVEAMASLEPGAVRDAERFTEPGSLANAYASYIVAVTEAQVDGGQASEFAVTTSEIKNGYEACFPDYPDEDCRKFANFEGEGGRIVDFTLDGRALRGTIVTGDNAPLSTGSLGKVEFLFGRETSDGVWVVIRASSGSQPVNFGPYESTYRTPEGRQVTASNEDVTGPTELGAKSSATIAVFYPSVQLGGQVTLPVYSEDFITEESVSFRTK